MLNYSIFKKKHSDNSLTNYNYPQNFLSDFNSNCVSKEECLQFIYNKNYINKKDIYFYSSLKFKESNNISINLKKDANIDFINSKPSLVNLPFLRTNSKNEIKNYYFQSSFYYKKNNKINFQFSNNKTPNNNSKEEMQKWLSRI